MCTASHASHVLFLFFFFSSRRRHTRFDCDWSSDVCSSDLVQRLTAVALVPLSIWFVASLLSLPSFDHATVVAWMSGSWTALLLILLVLTCAWHSQLGVRVVVEDYVRSEEHTSELQSQSNLVCRLLLE